MSNDIQNGLPKDLEDGLYGAILRTDNDDIKYAWHAAQTYLGEDVLASPFQKLKDDLELSKLFELVSRPEVSLALIIVAREIDPRFSLFDDYRDSLEMPEQAAEITKRFPAMTAQRIERVLQTELMQVSPV